MFDDKELKRLLKGCLPTTVVNTGLGAGEKVGRKGKKVVDPVARAVFCESVGTVCFSFSWLTVLLLMVNSSVIVAGPLTTRKAASIPLAPSLASDAMKQVRVVLPTGSCHVVGRAGTRGRRQRMPPW